MAREAAFSPGELAAYERYWDAVRVERTLLSGKKAEGREEGEAVGFERGRAEGRAEGRALERQALISRLIAKGMTEAEAREWLGGDDDGAA